LEDISTNKRLVKREKKGRSESFSDNKKQKQEEPNFSSILCFESMVKRKQKEAVLNLETSAKDLSKK
jgi:hypothetical protein